MGLILELKERSIMGKKDKTSENTKDKLNLVIKSGKYKIGYKLAMRAMRNGQAKLVLISNNCPAIRKTQIEYMAILGGSRVLHFEETTLSSELPPVDSTE